MPAGITNLEELSNFLAECGCCPPPRCCAPIVEYRTRYCNSGAGGYPIASEGSPGADKVLYTTRTETTSYHDWYSGTRTFVPSATTYVTTVSRDVAWTLKEIWQISPMSLTGDHSLGWLVCTGSITTPCEDKYEALQTQHEHATSSTGTPPYDASTRDYIYHVKSGIVGSSCVNEVLEDSTTESGELTPLDVFIPTPETADDVGDCNWEGTSLVEILLHADATYSYTYPGGDYSDHTESESHIYKTFTTSYTNPVTKDDLIDYARARMADAANPWHGTTSGEAILKTEWPVWPTPPDPPPADPCDTPSCETGICYANAFQYRFKLDKCCGYKTVRSEWTEVFLPQAYLDWLDEIESIPDPDDWPPSPGGIIITPKVWVWEGSPPLCPDEESASDPYSDESMWSPWSDTVKVPEGSEGMVFLRGYQQFCGPPLPDEMPGVLGEPYETPEDED